MMKKQLVLNQLTEIKERVLLRQKLESYMEDHILTSADQLNGNIFSRVLEVFIMIDLDKNPMTICTYIDNLKQHILEWSK